MTRAGVDGERYADDRDREIIAWSATTAGISGEIVPRQLVSAQDRNGEFVFTTSGITPAAGWSTTKKRLDAAMGSVPAWVIHDLRRSAATGMAEISIQPHIIEAILNHVSGHKAGVAGVYNRAAYAAEKREALEKWAAHIQSIVDDTKIVTIRGGRA